MVHQIYRKNVLSRKKPLIACVVGTRPDAIKTVPVVLDLKKYPDLVNVRILSTGQHREILDPVFRCFNIEPDADLSIMREQQTLSGVTARCIDGLDRLLLEIRPDFVLMQGDTTASFVASLVSFYQGIPFGHIEAGLRTATVRSPFPEEFNRRATSLIATCHFAPTQWAVENMLQEGCDREQVFLTGNTGIDAVSFVAGTNTQEWFEGFHGRILLLTTHRRENWGQPQRQITEAMLELVQMFPDVLLVVSVHPNPVVKEVVTQVLGSHPRVKLIDPPEYPQFVKLMQRSHLIFTDSGGIQEEAPAFGKPVLILRDNTERPEGIRAGAAKLVGCHKDRIVTEGIRLLSHQSDYELMARAVCPYGDGRAAERIRYLVLRYLGIDSPAVSMLDDRLGVTTNA